MPKRKPPELKYTLICDDIRNEIGNKRSLIGVYSGSIIVPRLPYAFPKLCFHLAFRGLRSGDIIKARLLDSHKTEVLKLSENKVDLPETTQDLKCIIEMGIIGLLIKKGGTHSLEFVLGDAKQPFGKFDFEIEKLSREKGLLLKAIENH